MRDYPYHCEECGPFTLEVATLEEFEEVTIGTKQGHLFPCPECSRLCVQDYSRKKLGGYVSDSKIVGSSNIKDRRTNEENWMRKEAEISKKHIFNTKEGKSPYSTMAVNYDNLIGGGTKNPRLKERGLDYSKKTGKELINDQKQISKLNEKYRKKSNKDFNKD